MALTKIKGNVVDNFIETFSTLSSLTSAKLPIGARVCLIKYHADEDMEPAFYEIVAGGTGTPDLGSYHNIANGKQARLLHQGRINVKWFGARGDASVSTDNTPAFNDAITFARSIGASVYIPDSIGFYRLTDTIILTTGDKLLGAGRYQSVLYFDPPSVKNCIIMNGARRAEIRDLWISGSANSLSGIVMTADTVNNNNNHIENVTIQWVNGDGLQIANSLSNTFIRMMIGGIGGPSGRPKGLDAIAGSLGSIKTNYYIFGNAEAVGSVNPATGNTIIATSTNEQVFIGCISDGGAGDSHLRWGHPSFTTDSHKWVSSRVQTKGVLLGSLNLTTRDTLIQFSHYEEDSFAGPDPVIWGVEMRNCVNTVIEGPSIAQGSIKLINCGRSGLRHLHANDIEIDENCEDCFVENSTYNAQSTGPTGGRLHDFGVRTTLKNVWSSANSNFGSGDNIQDNRFTIFRSNMESWVSPSGTPDTPCGFLKIGSPTVTREATIKRTGSFSAKVVGSGTSYLTYSVPSETAIQLVGKEIFVETYIRNETTPSLVIARVNINAGATIYSVGITPVADKWYRVRFTAKIPAGTTALRIDFLPSGSGTYYVDDFIIQCDQGVSLPDTNTLGSGATPEIYSNGGFVPSFVKAGAGSNITSFLRPIVGVPFTVVFTGARTIVHGTDIKLNGSANFVGAAGDTLTLKYFDDGTFKEVGRMKV